MPCRKTEHAYIGILLLVGVQHSVSAKVLDFSIDPSVTVSQTYSDNFRIRSSALETGKPEGFLTNVAPALNIARSSSRLQFSFNTQLQYLYYEGVDISPRLYPQLQLNSKAELYDKSIYVDTTGTVSQSNASAIGGFSPTNTMASTSVNSTTYNTFRLSPYWLPHFGGYADGEIRLGYSRFGNSASSSSGGTTSSSISNLGTDSYQESVYLHSGRKFDSTGLSWRLSFNNQDQQRSGSNTSNLSNVRFSSTNGEISLRLVHDLSAFVQMGYYDNNYSGNAKTSNGFYVTPGLYWKPSPGFSLAAGYGYNTYFSNLTWNPSSRTSFQINYRNSQVCGSNSAYQTSGIGGSFLAGNNQSAIPGLTLGGASVDSASLGAGLAGAGGYATGGLGSSSIGSVWNGSLRHQTRSSSWTASYITSTSTIQQLLTNLATFTTPTDLNGNPIGTPTANDRATGLPNFSDGVIVSKRLQVSVSWLISKHSFLLTGYQNDISYSSSTGNDQNILGIQTNWSWRFSPRMTSTVQGYWQTAEYKGSRGGSTDYLSASVIISRQLSSFVSGSLNFSHYQTSSSNLSSGNTLNGLGSYDSNSITASLHLTF